ncbi:MAG: Aminopeptidase [Gemmatimonadetes bacterium]|nr:Aminopeptidase [Gemmatimonadota bacterium]
MSHRFLMAVSLLASAGASAQLPERAVRRDIPMTNAIRRAFAAGTRDSTGRPGRNYAQLRTDYTINAKLDPSTSRIAGHETIVVQNNTADSLSAIVMRLDMNLFIAQNPHAAPWTPAEVTDGFVISRMTVNGAPVNLAPVGRGGGRGGGAPAAPTENRVVGLNTTRATISLVKPIPAKGTATLEIDWSHKVPGGPGANHRMTQRWADTLYQPTQWYPRVAVYDDLRGWDPELYVGPSEFYNNFGKFDVRIDVPAGWIVGGTGVLQNPQDVLTSAARERLTHVLESDDVRTIVGTPEVGAGQATAAGDRLVWHFVADTVNDFAWVTGKKLNWTATRATIPGKSRIPVNMYFLPGDSALYANAGPITRHALEFYSALWFPFQFPQMTLQDGPSAGMEYPMVINSNQGAADHETGHQWWPMTVSNNETWYGWMDEGFNQYMNILSGADSRKIAPVLDRLGQSYGSVSGDEAEPPMMWNANYDGPSRYGFTTYSKTPLMLSMLGGIVGDSAVQRAQSEWGKTWMFKHPSPWDYMFFMNKALNKDLSWFWYYWLFTTESVDGSIQGVSTSGTKTTVTVHQAGQMPSPVVLKVEFAAKGPAIRKLPNAVMADSTTAILTWPADVWFAGSRTFKATLDFGARKIERVVLDPGCRFPDRDPSDNAWPRVAAVEQAAQGPRGVAGACVR